MTHIFNPKLLHSIITLLMYLNRARFCRQDGVFFVKFALVVIVKHNIKRGVTCCPFCADYLPAYIQIGRLVHK